MSPGALLARIATRPRRALRKARRLVTKVLLERRGPAAIRLAPNAWQQDERASLADVLAELGPEPVRPTGPLRIAHIVNPFTAPLGSGHEPAQSATLASMRRAKGLARDGLVVDLVAVRHVDDDLSGLDGFVAAPPLTRTVLDVGSFAKPRPLPILSDILERGVQASPDADVVVYTNVDINVAPHFYETLRALWAHGFDAMTINRRTVAVGYEGHASGADWMLAAADPGDSHSGFDCFVFPRRDFDSFVPSRACVGMPPVGRSLLFNMVARAQRIVMLTNVQMTYHFGNDLDWRDPVYRDYYRFNLTECRAIVQAYQGNPVCFARLDPFLEAHKEYRRLRKLDAGDVWTGQNHG